MEIKINLVKWAIVIQAAIVALLMLMISSLGYLTQIGVFAILVVVVGLDRYVTTLATLIRVDRWLKDMLKEAKQNE